MGRQIIRQPDGKFSIWSTIVDNFVTVDCEDADEIIEEFLDDARREITDMVYRVVGMLERGGKPYHQFTKTYNECLDLIKEVHGDDEYVFDADQKRNDAMERGDELRDRAKDERGC